MAGSLWRKPTEKKSQGVSLFCWNSRYLLPFKPPFLGFGWELQMATKTDHFSKHTSIVEIKHAPHIWTMSSQLVEPTELFETQSIVSWLLLFIVLRAFLFHHWHLQGVSHHHRYIGFQLHLNLGVWFQTIEQIRVKSKTIPVKGWKKLKNRSYVNKTTKRISVKLRSKNMVNGQVVEQTLDPKMWRF